MSNLEPIFDEKGYVHYVYKLTFVPDNRFYYYGKHSTKNLNDNYGGRGALVYRWKKKYGSQCFRREILSFWPSKDLALKEEHRIVGNLWTTDPFCLNQCPGGENNGTIDNTGLVWVTLGEQQKLIKPEFIQNYEERGWRKGVPESVRKKSSLSQKGRKFSEEHKKALSLAKLGTTIPKDVRKKMSLAAKGRPKSEEARSNMRKAQQALSEYHRQLCHNSAWVKKNGISKKIKKDELNQYLSQGWERGFIKSKKNAILSKN